MITTYSVQVKFPASSSITADDVVHSFHFKGGGVLATRADDVAKMLAQLDSFYGTAHLPGTAALRTYMNGGASGVGTPVVKIYDLADASAPGAPRRPISNTVRAAMAPSGNTGLAPQLAVVLSYKAARPSGTNVRRRQGRLYFGPLTVATNTDTRVLQGLRNALAGGASFLVIDGTTTNATAWAVYSKTDGIAREVVDGFVDDVFDTQRRRHFKTANRQTW